MGELAQVLRTVAPAGNSEQVLVGADGFDDAGAIRAADGSIRLYSTDFFPPVVDDPGAYGAIAAANSISDIYAMGGEPKVVLNLAGFPEDWDDSVTRPLFEAATAKVRESGALWIGGHTVRSAEPLFGFAVFGETTEDRLFVNSAAEAGDLLFLTKPIGAGSLTTAVSRGEFDPAQIRAAERGMAFLNRDAATAGHVAGVRAATDITGFGLFGHAGNIAKGSQVTINLRSVALPLYEGAAELAAAGILSGGSARNRQSLGDLIEVAGSVPPWLADICYDAETSGGLLLAVKPERQQDFLTALPEKHHVSLVGEVTAGPAKIVLQ